MYNKFVFILTYCGRLLTLCTGLKWIRVKSAIQDRPLGLVWMAKKKKRRGVST